MAGLFSEGVRRRCEHRKRRLHDAAREFVHGLGDRLIELSPVLTGKFRSNWFLGVDAVVRVTTESVNIHEVNNLEAIPKEAAGHNYYISNALPYAMRLEWGFSGPDALGRVYNQGPMAFVSTTAIEAPSIARRAAQKVRMG